MLPFTIHAQVEAYDPERDDLTYEWDAGNGKKITTNKPVFEYTYTTPGDFPVSVSVTDKEKASSKSEVVHVYAGNKAPVVRINIEGNQTFYFPGSPVQYIVTVQDDDTAAMKDHSNLVVTADYTEAKGKEAILQGHQSFDRLTAGKSLMMSMDCMSCHKIAEKSVGPGYENVAQRYQKLPDAASDLTQKIIQGGKGVWGEVPMPPHQKLKESDARMIVDWILSLGSATVKKSLPVKGSLSPSLGKPLNDYGVLFISATYTDRGAHNIRPLSVATVHSLRNNKLTFEDVQKMQGFVPFTVGNHTVMVVPQNSGWFRLDSLDLSGIVRASLKVEWIKPPLSAHTIEIHLDSESGEKLGEFLIGPSQSLINKSKKITSTFILSRLKNITDGKLHNVIITSTATDPKNKDEIGLATIQFYNK
jgi:cytochrome c551/c552